jgi:hypothetical protein
MYVCKSIQLLATNMRQPRDVYHRGYYYMHLYACMYGAYVRIYTCIQLVLQWSETCKHVMYVYMVCMCIWYVCTITLECASATDCVHTSCTCLICQLAHMFPASPSSAMSSPSQDAHHRLKCWVVLLKLFFRFGVASNFCYGGFLC